MAQNVTGSDVGGEVIVEERPDYRTCLIGAVQRQPQLWKSSLDDYKSHDKRADAWCLVMKEMSAFEVDLETLKNDWKKARDTFRRACKSKKTGSAAGRVTWPYFSIMEFLRTADVEQKRLCNTVEEAVPRSPPPFVKPGDDDVSESDRYKATEDEELIEDDTENNATEKAIQLEEGTPSRRVLGQKSVHLVEGSTPRVKKSRQSATGEIIGESLRAMKTLTESLGERIQGGAHLAESMREMTPENQKKMTNQVNRLIVKYSEDEDDDLVVD